MYDRLGSHVQQFPNVKMTSWRLATIWGSSNLYEVWLTLRWAQCTQRSPCSSAAHVSAPCCITPQTYLRGIAELLPYPWDYFINVSGSDLPLRYAASCV
jgi:hypothetical protein